MMCFLCSFVSRFLCFVVSLPFSMLRCCSPVFCVLLFIYRFLCWVVSLPFSVLQWLPSFLFVVSLFCSVVFLPFFVPLFLSRFLCSVVSLLFFVFRCFSPVFYTNVFCVVLLTFSFRSSLTFRMELHVKLGQFLLCFDCLSVSSSPLFSPSLPYQPSLHFLSTPYPPFSPG